MEARRNLLPSPSQGRTPGSGFQCGGGEQLSGIGRIGLETGLRAAVGAVCPSVGCTGVNPAGVQTTAITGSFTQSGGAVSVAPQLTLADVDSTTASGATVTLASGDDTVCTVTNTKQVDGLNLEKTTAATSFSAVGEVIGFTIKVTNTGTAPFSAVTVADASAVLTGCTAASLPPGGVLLLENVRYYNEEEANDPAFADKLEKEAADLKRRFNRDFWVEDGEYFALALDPDGNQVDALASNNGHLLWSGIVDKSKAKAVARQKS